MDTLADLPWDPVRYVPADLPQDPDTDTPADLPQDPDMAVPADLTDLADFHRQTCERALSGYPPKAPSGTCPHLLYDRNSVSSIC